MKKPIYLGILWVLSLLSACGDAGKDGKETQKALQTVSDMVYSAGDIATRQKELNEMTPISPEDYKKWSPSSFMGLTRKEKSERISSFQEDRESAYKVTYKGEGKTLTLEIADGAKTGKYSSYAGMLSTTAMNQEKENYYEKNLERNGMIVNEWYNSMRKDMGLLFIVEKRFIVKITSNNISPNDFWSNYEQLNLEAL